MRRRRTPKASVPEPTPALTETGTETGAARPRWRRIVLKVAGGGRRSVVITSGGVVLALLASTTLGIGVSHALSSPGTSTSTTAVTTPPTTSTTQTSTSTPTPTTTTTTAPETVAPVITPPGGAIAGHGSFNALDCPTPTRCVAVGADGSGAATASYSTDGGTTWTEGALPATTPELDAVSCRGATHCVAVGRGAIVSSADGGHQWRSEPVPTAQTTLLGVSCNATACAAVGVYPELDGALVARVALATNDGTDWHEATVPPGTTGLAAVACPTVATCIAVGEGIEVSSDGGQTWTTATVPGGLGSALLSISCWSSIGCIALGPNPGGASQATLPAVAIVTTDAGASWTHLTLPASSWTVSRVTCDSAHCQAVGSALPEETSISDYVSADDGQTWQAGTPPAGVTSVAAIACPTATSCVVTGRTGTNPVVATTTPSTGGVATTLPAT